MIIGTYLAVAGALTALGLILCVGIVLHARRKAPPPREIDYSADVPPHQRGVWF